MDSENSMDSINNTDESPRTSAYGDEWKWLLATFKRPAPETAENAPKRIYSVAIVLSLLLGWTGIDRFYLGKIGTGILKMISLGGLGIWWIIDLYLMIGGSPKDVNGVPLAGSEHKDSFIYIFLTVFACGFGLHYLYLGFKRLCLTRFALFVLYLLVAFWYGSDPFNPSIFAKILLFPLLLALIVWGIVDLYIAVTGKVRMDAAGEPLLPPTKRYQSICLLLALAGGFLGLDRFYLGHRVLGILKLFTLGGFFTWYLLDIVLAILNAHKDSNGQPLVQE